MLNRVNTYFKGLWKQRAPYLTNHSFSFNSKGHCCLSYTDSEILLVYLQKEQDKIILQLCESYPYKNETEFSTILTQANVIHRLKNIPCTWMLQSNQYQSFSMEALPVEDSEFQSAIRWKIKPMISFSIEDAVIDAFPIPQQKANELNKMITTVVARASYLETVSNTIKKSGFNIHCIDILDLGLRNMTTLLEEGERSIALIYLDETNAELIITHHTILYLTRMMELGIKEIRNSDMNSIHACVEKFALDLLRSFDYYQAYWRLPPPVQLIWAPIKKIPSFFTEELSNRLNMPVYEFNLKNFFTIECEIENSEQEKFLPLIGCALRGAKTTHATAN